MKEFLGQGNRAPHMLSRAVSVESGRRESNASHRHWASAGFTLIELMIVVVIVAILSALAYPSYVNYIVKTKRKAAEACLSEYANYMERYYTTNLNYSIGATLPAMDCSATSQTGQNYQYTPAVATSTAYTIQAAAISGTQQAEKDAACTPLTLDQSGNRMPATGCW